MYGQNAGSGILGLGLGSPIWNLFTDPETNTALYSIAIARSTAQNSAVSTNVTFGEVNNDYVGQPSVFEKAANDTTYQVSFFSFGIVYEVNGTDSSEYFEDLN